MSCVAWSNQTPIGTASNFLQCKWVSCRKSYWQGCDLGWYKEMGAPCFPQPNLWLARCASMSWTALKKFVVLSAQELRIGIKPSFHCGRKAWQVLSVLRLRRLLCLFRLVPSCRLRRLARWCEMAQMVSTATQPRYATAMFHSNQPETFPLSAGVSSRPYLPSVPNKATETVIFCFGKMFARAAAAAGGSSRQAAAAGGGSSRQAAAGKQQQARSSRQAAAAGKQQQQASRRKQQQQDEAAAAGSSSSRRRRKQQQQQAEAAAAAAGGSSSSRRRKQQQQAEAAAAGSSSRQAAAGSSTTQQQQEEEAATAAGGSSNSRRMQQQQQASSRQAAAAGDSRRQAAAGKQQASSNQRLPPWKNDQTYFLKINAIKKMNFFQPHGPKTMKSFNY